ncbi:hypothetical protein IAQ61_011766 [Plenodomus lingam]|uniref:uncharacterized protein n=1 Tax=Leptosphaeria maculans TaxID=5022 RepID=UPI00331E995C|nr:hypothetical protein IAQ61_011766 [Plenodomus lingam]
MLVTLSAGFDAQKRSAERGVGLAVPKVPARHSGLINGWEWTWLGGYGWARVDITPPVVGGWLLCVGGYGCDERPGGGGAMHGGDERFWRLRSIIGLKAGFGKERQSIILLHRVHHVYTLLGRGSTRDKEISTLVANDRYKGTRRGQVTQSLLYHSAVSVPSVHPRVLRVLDTYRIEQHEMNSRN